MVQVCIVNGGLSEGSQFGFNDSSELADQMETIIKCVEKLEAVIAIVLVSLG